ncbi:hypothetical protein BaRGS_00005003 [Batillaria attramentaria]|uniref:Uncharacterized protein n=1 Tax=Batillaria attramentaria TaxID=370345 RepID=A0ABD0LXH7_9CAEN
MQSHQLQRDKSARMEMRPTPSRLFHERPVNGACWGKTQSQTVSVVVLEGRLVADLSLIQEGLTFRAPGRWWPNQQPH